MVNDPNFIIREISLLDFNLLSGSSWLTGSLVSVVMAMINKSNQYQVIDEAIGTVIFKERHFTDYFLDKFSFQRDCLAMPVIINQNHFCLAIANLTHEKFIFIDPMGSRISESNKYLGRFNHFLNFLMKLRII